MVTCEQFLDAREEGRPVAIRIVNVGERPILLDSPCSSTDFLALATRSGWTWPAGHCVSTCEGEFASGCSVCGPCVSAMYDVVMPGAFLEVEWPGILYEHVTPPQECFPFGSCGDGCPRARVDFAEAIAVDVEAIAYDDCAAQETDPSVCTCAEAQTCQTHGSVPIAPTLSNAVAYEPGAPGPIIIEIRG
jgi:hypothetical protein